MDLHLDNMPTFSIVMPSHNRKDLLERALTHLSRQTYPAHLLEMVLVLDGCNDGSAEMVEQLRPSFPLSLRLINQAQSGPAAARNTGVREAKGEYILFIDDDVMATSGLVMEHYQSHLENPRTIIIGPMSKPLDYKGPVWTLWEEHILEKQYDDILNGKYKITPRQFYTGNCSLKRSWIIEAGLFDEDFKRYEDVELAFRLKQLNLNFEFNPRAIGFHYVQRSFESWCRMHYLYGRYAVKMEREKQVKGWIDLAREEFGYRHWLTRLLSKQLLHRKAAQKAATWLLLQVAVLTTNLKQERVSFRALSSVANMLFWQGFNEELNLPFPAQNAPTPDTFSMSA